MKQERGEIILVTGGARSGKSAFAERYVATHGRRIAYIATAQVLDDEMRYRVELHKRRRPETWRTYEAPFAAEQAIAKAASDRDTILFDCVTIYLSNLICSFSEEQIADEALVHAQADAAIDRLIAAVRAGGVRCVFVTNEVGAGIVPEHRLSRLYRDAAGRANQRLAQEAEAVYLTVAGIPVNLRKLAEEQQ